MIRRSLALATVLLLPLVLTGAARADTPDPAGTVTITPATGGATRDSLVPVAGSPDALAYVQSAPVNAGVDDAEVLLRSSSGAVTDLGPEPDDPDALYSLVDTSLTSSGGGDGATVHWWDTATKASGTIELPSDEAYLSSAPGGFVYNKAGGAYLEKTADSSVTSLGSPFAGADFAAVGGSTGVLFTSSTAAKFATWADPTNTADVDTGGLPLACNTVEGDYAACTTGGLHGNAELLKLDGSGPVAMPATDGGTAEGLAGSTLVTLGAGAHLYSRSYLSATIHTSTGVFGAFVISAYGAAIVQPEAFTSIESTTSASATPHTLFTAPYGPPNTTDFSLAPGQIGYNDNRRNAAVPPATSSTLRTPVSTTASSLSAGATTTVRAGDSGAATYHDGSWPTTPLVSGTTIGYPSAAHYIVTQAQNEVVTESLTVIGPHRSHVIANIILDEPRYSGLWAPQLSGNRLTYFAQTGTGTPAFFLYDVAKDSTSKLLSVDPTKAFLSTPAVSGNFVAIMHADGSIMRRNIDTGVSVQVAPADGDFDAATGGSVFARGDYVGWWRWDHLNEDSDTLVGGYRNAASMAPAVTDNNLEGLAATGVIDSLPGGGHHNVLHEFGGATATLPTTTLGGTTFNLVSDLQVEGRVAAWIDVAGLLKVSPVDVTPAAPRMEGDTIAPKPAHPNEVVWHGYVPYSEPLTACSMAVMSGGRTVATLSCNNAEMALGIADIEWNGVIGGVHAHAGTYHYEITAAGDGGAALDSAGTATPVAGHFILG